MHSVGISTYQFIPYYASAIHKHTWHTRILKPFENSKPTGLKLDIADGGTEKEAVWFTVQDTTLCERRGVVAK